MSNLIPLTEKEIKNLDELIKCVLDESIKKTKDYNIICEKNKSASNNEVICYDFYTKITNNNFFVLPKKRDGKSSFLSIAIYKKRIETMEKPKNCEDKLIYTIDQIFRMGNISNNPERFDSIKEQMRNLLSNFIEYKTIKCATEQMAESIRSANEKIIIYDEEDLFERTSFANAKKIIEDERKKPIKKIGELSYSENVIVRHYFGLLSEEEYEYTCSTIEKTDKIIMTLDKDTEEKKWELIETDNVVKNVKKLYEIKKTIVPN